MRALGVLAQVQGRMLVFVVFGCGCGLDTDEIHPMHLHQVHFLAYAQNGVPLENPVRVDTVNVPYRGNVDVIVAFTDPSFAACPSSTVIC